MRDGRWLATHSRALVHGVGDTQRQAAEDFQEMLVDLYKELVRSEEVLAAHLQKALQYLRSVVAASALG